MEVRPGVFISSIDPLEWVPDDDPAGEMHELCRTPEVWAGAETIWHPTTPFKEFLGHQLRLPIRENHGR